jgi:hypothetical protein
MDEKERLYAYIELLKDTMADVEVNMSRIHSSMCGLAAELLKHLPAEVVLDFSNPVEVYTWNKGYIFRCKGLKKRASDDSIMMVGTYCGKDDEEFLSYVHGYEQDKKMVETMLKIFKI